MSTQALQKKIVLGDEYDEKLRENLLATLQNLGVKVTRQWRGVGGSQELEKLAAIVDGKAIDVEAETYIGLTISGDADLVDRVAALVSESARQRRNPWRDLVVRIAALVQHVRKGLSTPRAR